jgi:hypothetical protein
MALKVSKAGEITGENIVCTSDDLAQMLTNFETDEADGPQWQTHLVIGDREVVVELPTCRSPTRLPSSPPDMSEEHQWRIKRVAAGWEVSGYGYREEVDSFEQARRFILRYARMFEAAYKAARKGERA